MATITMEQIQTLRAKTNAGIMDCKRALQDTEGDFDNAIDLLRKKGIARAAKRSEREANEGIVKVEVSADGKQAFMIQLQSETDFVSQNDKFQRLAEDCLEALKKSASPDLESFLKVELQDGKTVAAVVDELSGVIGEKISLGNAQTISAEAEEAIGSYTHINGKIGVVAMVKNGAESEAIIRDLCMHIAAASPLYVRREDVPASEVNREKAVLRDQVLNSGKPEQLADKIVEGKLRKYFEEICLLEQKYVKDPDQTVGSVVKAAGKDLSVTRFVRFQIGS